MAKNDNLKDFLTDVADAIREKKGTTDLINPQDFSAEIASIQSGGGAVAVSAKAVNFRDYDGTILHSYTKDEFLALSELPPLPTREGLICQEWNWDFADAVEYASEYGVLEVGATYITDDGKTRLYITIAAEGRMDVPLYFSQSVANGVTIDWGDGSATETLSGAGSVKTTHHYNAIGDYVISLEAADGCAHGLGHNSSSYCVMGSTGNNDRVYCNMLRRVECGKNMPSISYYAFERCWSLSLVTMPNSVKEIDNYAFEYCYSLRAIIIPKGVTRSGFYAFRSCISLELAILPSTSSGLADGVFSGCYSLRSILLPKRVYSIGFNTFYYCYSLASLVLPKGFTSLANDVFPTCYSLASMVFPKGFKGMGTLVFQSCYGMKYYDFSALESVPSLASTNVFRDIPSDCKIIVPDALFDEWIAATNWSTYASYIIKKSEWDALNA